jgi:hypothetical protein
MGHGNYSQGNYTPVHPEKYVGDVNNITYRSSWEYDMNVFLDHNTNILHWNSEEIFIKYMHPDGKIHKYYPDYWVEYINSSGAVVQEILEVKPASQTVQPRHKRRTKTALYEDQRYKINMAKWAYAKHWCDQRNITFRLITEHELFSVRNLQKTTRVKKRRKSK